MCGFKSGEGRSSQVSGWLKFHCYIICILLIEKSITPSYLCTVMWGWLQYLRWGSFSSFSGFQLQSLQFMILKHFSSIFSMFSVMQTISSRSSSICYLSHCSLLIPSLSLFLSSLWPDKVTVLTLILYSCRSLLSHHRLSPLTSPLSNPRTASPPFPYTNITFSLAPIRKSSLSGQLLI